MPRWNSRPGNGHGSVRSSARWNSNTTYFRRCWGPARTTSSSITIISGSPRRREAAAQIRMKSTDPELARLAVRVGKALLRSERSAATAESCTGGWIAKAMTDIAGSSQWFIEGFVTYSNESKTRRLGVPISVLKSQGAVSEATVRAMAAGALERTGAHLAVAVTGIAGP